MGFGLFKACPRENKDVRKNIWRKRMNGRSKRKLGTIPILARFLEPVQHI